MEEKCFDIPHMECVGEGQSKACENVLRPVCWPVPREDFENCVDEEVCEDTREDDSIDIEVMDRLENNEDLEDLDYSENIDNIRNIDNKPPRCKLIDIEVCRPVPQAVNCS